MRVELGDNGLITVSVDPPVCEWCEGKPLPDREYTDSRGVTWDVPHGPCPECGVDHGEES